MSEYEIPVTGEVNDYIVPLHGHVEAVIRQYPVIPNPEEEATANLTKAGIDGTVYQIYDDTIPAWARTPEKPTYTKAEIGLGNVDNTSDLNKPISTATREALDTKVDKEAGKGLSANDFTNELKNKLDGIEEEANKTVVDSTVSADSTNPVESKAIYNLLNDLLPEATETGNPISITNASGLNAKSLKVELEPIQDLNGYDSPWVGGGGKNKFDTPTATSTGSKNIFYDKPLSLSAGTYTLSFSSEARTNTMSVAFKKNGTSVQEISIASGVNSSTFTLSEATDTITWYVREAVNLSNIQIESGNQATSYAPYSNICPISGRTQTTVKRTGLNIWDEQWEVGAIDSATGQNTQGTAGIRTKNYIEVTSNETYFCYIGGLTGYNLKPRWYDKDKNYLGYSPSVPYGSTFTVPSNAHYLRFCPQDTYGTTYKHDICINISNASVNGTYEPYTEADTTIQFGQTVYGGEVDVTSGGTTSELKYMRFNGTETWSQSSSLSPSSIANGFVRYFTTLSENAKINANTICSSLQTITTSTYNTQLVGSCRTEITNRYEVLLKSSDFETPNDWQTYLTTNPIDVCYELATPTTINTPANEISLLKGNNTLTADGDMELIYSKMPQ